MSEIESDSEHVSVDASLLVMNDADDEPLHPYEIIGTAEIEPQLGPNHESVDIGLSIIDDTEDVGTWVDLDPEQARTIADQLYESADELETIRERMEHTPAPFKHE